MPTPEFILALRERVGHDRLWLCGASAVVVNGCGEVLLTRRVDSGQWAVVSGIIEPGEQPAETLRREILEETGVVAAVERLVSVLSLPVTVYPNGDVVQFLDLTFACRYVSGTAHVADDESVEVGWFDSTALPDLGANGLDRVLRALAPGDAVYFER